MLSVILSVGAGMINILSELDAEFKIEQIQRERNIRLEFQRIVALAKSPSGIREVRLDGHCSAPSLVNLEISVGGQSLVKWERPRQTLLSRPILDVLTERWITYERTDAETGVYL